jgi:hypothetical protein
MELILFFAQDNFCIIFQKTNILLLNVLHSHRKNLLTSQFSQHLNISQNRKEKVGKILNKYLVTNDTLFEYSFHGYRYNMEVNEEKIDTYNISVGVF